MREALDIAIDREAIKRSVMRGMSLPAGILVAPGVNGHTAELDKPLKPDLVKAKKLLADAGYPNGFEFQLNCPEQPLRPTTRRSASPWWACGPRSA